MNVAQYFAKYLAGKGVDRVFMLTGGGAMFLNDAFSFEPGMSPVFCHHEQACAMAAEGYARVAQKPGVLNVTTGPGGINALNGVYGAYMDSVPMLVVSGQVKRSTHLRSTPVQGLRQLGDQEVDIVAMAAPVCKAALSVLDPLEAPKMLAEAWALCQSGRPGPAWLDVPIDVQSASLPDDLVERALAGGFDPKPEALAGELSGGDLEKEALGVLEQIQAAKRPLMLWGSGVRLAGVSGRLLAIAEKLDCPVATAWTHDTIESAHRLFAGRPGTIGTRPGNYAHQKSHLVVVLGSRLNIRQTSYNFESFAKNAKLIQIDIDEAELRKPTMRPDQAVCAELSNWVGVWERLVDSCPKVNRAPWLGWIQSRREKYGQKKELASLIGPGAEGKINPYAMVDHLFGSLPERAVVVTGNASACIMSFQIGEIRKGQRLFSNSGAASMGYDLPAAIGAAVADPSRLVVALAGDGSLQMNIQELETIGRLGLNLKVVVIDNEGYLSIKSSQANFFKRFAGCGPDSGVGFPDFQKIAIAYGLPACKIEGARSDWRQKLAEALAAPGPGLIHAKVDPEQGFAPRMSSRRLEDGTIVSPEIEDMHPFLSREELAWAMGDEI